MNVKKHSKGVSLVPTKKGNLQLKHGMNKDVNKAAWDEACKIESFAKRVKEKEFEVMAEAPKKDAKKPAPAPKDAPAEDKPAADQEKK